MSEEEERRENERKDLLTVSTRLLVASSEPAAVVLLVKITRRADAQVATRTLNACASVCTRIVGAKAGQSFTMPSRVSQRAVTGVITLLWISL